MNFDMGMVRLQARKSGNLLAAAFSEASLMQLTYSAQHFHIQFSKWGKYYLKNLYKVKTVCKFISYKSFKFVFFLCFVAIIIRNLFCLTDLFKLVHFTSIIMISDMT